MIYIPTSLLTEGMKPIHSIPNLQDATHPLAVKGVPLTKEIISQLKQSGVAGCYVSSELFEADVSADCKSLITHSASLAYVKEAIDSGDKDNLEQFVDSAISDTESLGNLHDIRSFDSCTYEHSLRVMLMSISIGEKLSLSKDELHKLAMAALLHDVGKLDIPVSVLNKRGKLDTDERKLIEQHPMLGYKHAAELYDFDKYITDGILYHHEREDGSGYPSGLKGDEIPMCAKIIAVADVFDALTSIRPYREPWYPNEAIEYMTEKYRNSFNHKVYDAFLKVAIPYPVGSSVLLSDNSVAVVTQVNKEDFLRPVLRRLPSMDKIDMRQPENWNLVIRGVCYTDQFLEALRKGGKT